MIVDRTRDLVKSGGERSSAIDVENAAHAIPGIANCAVIGVPHPKCNERPPLVVAKAWGANPSNREILGVLGTKRRAGRCPMTLRSSTPALTATGKVSKGTCAAASHG